MGQISFTLVFTTDFNTKDLEFGSHKVYKVKLCFIG